MNKLTKVLFLVLFLSALRYPLPATYAAVPHLINYQGRLTDTSGSPLNGLYNITFRIYDAETAGNLLWQGTYTSTSVDRGIFNILLGDLSDTGFNFSNLAFDKPYWLEIKVGTDDPMAPRQRITSAGYAITAEKAEQAKVKTDDSDPIPGNLSDKVDGLTIQVNSSRKLEVKGGLTQYIKSHENNYKIDCGSTTMVIGETRTINFNFAFLTPPVIAVSQEDNTNQNIAATYIRSRNTTSFVLQSSVDHTIIVHWIAIGPAA